MSSLDAFLRPIGAAFLQEHFSKSAATFEPKSTLQSDPVWQQDGWKNLPALRFVDAATRDAEGQHSQQRIDTSDIARALAEGCTICGDITSYPPVRTWLDDASRALGTPAGGFAKLYASPTGTGFPMHLDPHHVFVLQCRGSKRWRFGRTPALPHASQNAKVAADGGSVFSGRYEGVSLVGGNGMVPAPSDDALEEVVLQPGDALYLPPGTWHTACAEELSLAISLSPARLTPYDLIVQWLDGQSLRHPEWFEDLDASHSAIGDVLSAAIAGVRQSLTSADVTTLARQWALQMGEGSNVPAQEAFLIERHDVLERRTQLPVVETPEAFVFFGGGQEWSLPLVARPFLDGLRSTTRFTAEDVLLWDEELRWPAAKEILEELVGAGVLMRAK